jgi:hypothetical protein
VIASKGKNEEDLHPCEVKDCTCPDYQSNGAAFGICARTGCGHRDVDHSLDDPRLAILQRSDEFLANMPWARRQLGNTEIIVLDDDYEDLALFALQIATGFDLPFFGSDNNDADFKAINDRLDVISKQLDMITNDLGHILSRLEQLPEEIRGFIDQSDLTQYLSDQRTSIQLLRPFMSSKNFNPNVQTVQGLLNELAKTVNRIIGLTGGRMSGFSMSCSGFGVWAQGQTMVLNVPSVNPAGQSIWDQPFYSTNMSMIRGVFDTAEALAPQYASRLQDIPGGNYCKYENGRFHRFSISGSYHYEPDVFLASNLGSGPDHQQWSLFSSVKGTPTFPAMFRPCADPFWGYFEHPDLVKQAASLWSNQLLPQLITMTAFEEEFQNFEQYRDKIYAATSKPVPKPRQHTPKFAKTRGRRI